MMQGCDPKINDHSQLSTVTAEAHAAASAPSSASHATSRIAATTGPHSVTPTSRDHPLHPFDRYQGAVDDELVDPR